MGTERVAKEVEALLAGVIQRGFVLIDRQPELCHHRLRPRQRPGRTAMAQDDEVVGIGDDMSAERFAAAGQTPDTSGTGSCRYWQAAGMRPRPGACGAVLSPAAAHAPGSSPRPIPRPVLSATS